MLCYFIRISFLCFLNLYLHSKDFYLLLLNYLKTAANIPLERKRKKAIAFFLKKICRFIKTITFAAQKIPP